MFLGRAGVIGYYAQKHKNQKTPQESFLTKHKKECKEKNKKKDILEFVEYPIAAWIMGVLMIASGGALIYLVSMGKNNSIFSEFNDGFWWQYIISIIIFLLGFIFLFAVDVEKVQIVKKLNVLIVLKWNFLGKSKYLSRNLEDSESINIIKKGHDSRANSTVHYVIRISFKTERDIEILENNSRWEVKKKFIEINSYLEKEIDCDKIKVINETTSTNYKKEKYEPSKEEEKSQEKRQITEQRHLLDSSRETTE